MPGERTTSETIYVLDDDASVRRSIGRLLASEGLKFRTFGDPKSLLSAVAEQPVPIVILDIWMEKITGLEVQSKLLRLSPRTRVIIMTDEVMSACKKPRWSWAQPHTSPSRSTTRNLCAR